MPHLFPGIARGSLVHAIVEEEEEVEEDEGVCSMR